MCWCDFNLSKAVIKEFKTPKFTPDLPHLRYSWSNTTTYQLSYLGTGVILTLLSALPSLPHLPLLTYLITDKALKLSLLYSLRALFPTHCCSFHSFQDLIVITWFVSISSYWILSTWSAFFFFLPHHVAWGILVPRPRIKPASPTVAAQSLNPWTTREVP